MPGQSPLSMMRPARQPARPRHGVPRRLWRFLLLAAVIVALPIGWTALWSYAASIANEALSGWIDREAALGRVYACGSQSIGGFPFGIIIRCDQAAAAFNSNRPPFNVSAHDFTFSAQVFRPTLLNGEISAPVTLADPGQGLDHGPIFIANWSRAQLALLGLPPEPERVTIALSKPRLDRTAGAGAGMIFQADSLDVDGRIISGSTRRNPVIEATGRFTAALAPSFHPLLAAPLQGEIDAVMRGFKDFLPKPWPVLFRDMQAAGGGIEIKSLRLERPDAAVVGAGTFTINGNGRLEGELRVTVAGVENIVPLIGVDQLIGQGVDRLTGGAGSPAQGLSALDRLLPGLGGAVREGANAGLIETIKKLGEPTELNRKPAVKLPLRVTDGIVYVGVIPVATVPALF
ncbi:MAG TPA: DUF2125 domain-containing protein [Xanthobacteraceae bacterium]|jgi:hypothetical protein|nr:DUF2125 domain-containing protein [Xanthobacteraceae bacterium]